MKQSTRRTYVFWILLSEAIGLISGILSRAGTVSFRTTVQQPPLSPPAALFPIVWTILYALMGISAARISLTSPSTIRSRSLNIFIIQLVVNFFWSLIFFNAKAYRFSFLWLLLLWGLVFGMILLFR